MKWLREKYVSPCEFNRLLRYVRKNYKICFYAKPPELTFERCAYIEDKLVECRLSAKIAGEACTYITRKDSTKATQTLSGGEAYRIMSLYAKVPPADPAICGKADAGGYSASPILYKRDDFEGKRVKAIGYDLNGAYALALCGDMPDTTRPAGPGEVQPGQIGFGFYGEEERFAAVENGFALFRFPAVPSPFREFIRVWEKRKTESTDKRQREKAKQIVNFAVGNMQNHNPFYRATVVSRANNLVKSLIDENTIYSNTDSIVSLVERKDLPLSKEIGGWKVENKGEFAFIGFNYQWNREKPHYRGIPRSWFPKSYDILTDELPTCGNIYELDPVELQLKKANYAADAFNIGKEFKK